MPNSPDINKRVLSIRVPIELYVALQRAARFHRMGFNEFLRHIFSEATVKIELTKEDYAKIEVYRHRAGERARSVVRLRKSKQSG
jgi:hypothetical protein